MRLSRRRLRGQRRLVSGDEAASEPRREHDVVGLVKNYWTPVAKMLSETKKDETGEQAETKTSE